MEYQTHRTVISDHELIVDNVVYRERKEMSKVSQEGLDSDDYVLSHSRRIGDDFYTINHVFKDKIMETENIETNLDEESLENFKNQWMEAWKPRIGQKPVGVFGRLKALFK